MGQAEGRRPEASSSLGPYKVRRELLERKLEELEVLQDKTYVEISHIWAKDSILDFDASRDDNGGAAG